MKQYTFLKLYVYAFGTMIRLKSYTWYRTTQGEDWSKNKKIVFYLNLYCNFSSSLEIHFWFSNWDNLPCRCVFLVGMPEKIISPIYIHSRTLHCHCRDFCVDLRIISLILVPFLYTILGLVYCNWRFDLLCHYWPCQ